MKIFPLKFYSIASQLSGVGEQYSDLIRPHLEYACAVWAPFAACDIALLESVQNRAALWINSIWDPIAQQWSKSSAVCVKDLKC